LNILGLIISIIGVAIYNYIRIQKLQSLKDSYTYVGSPLSPNGFDSFDSFTVSDSQEEML